MLVYQRVFPKSCPWWISPIWCLCSFQASPCISTVGIDGHSASRADDPRVAAACINCHTSCVAPKFHPSHTADTCHDPILPAISRSNPTRTRRSDCLKTMCICCLNVYTSRHLHLFVDYTYIYSLCMYIYSLCMYVCMYVCMKVCK